MACMHAEMTIPRSESWPKIIWRDSEYWEDSEQYWRSRPVPSLFPYKTMKQATSEMSCCRCNRSGRCKNCSCVKSGNTCQGCLPQRLDNCTNASQPLQQLQSVQRSPSGPSQSMSMSPVRLSDQNVKTVIPEMPNTSANTISPLDEVSQTSSSMNITWPLLALQPPNFMWDSCSGETLCTRIEQAYEEVVHWRRNLFQVPPGAAGKAFVSELAHLFQAYAHSSSLECIAMKATTVILILLLQKPSRTSKSKDHVIHLQRHMELWHDGDIQALLLDEGKCIHKRLGKVTSPSSTDSDTIAWTCRDLMFKGKVPSALKNYQWGCS